MVVLLLVVVVARQGSFQAPHFHVQGLEKLGRRQPRVAKGGTRAGRAVVQVVVEVQAEAAAAPKGHAKATVAQRQELVDPRPLVGAQVLGRPVVEAEEPGFPGAVVGLPLSSRERVAEAGAEHVRVRVFHHQQVGGVVLACAHECSRGSPVAR